MKKKLLLTLALVFAAFTFCFKVKAQSSVPVILNYGWSNSSAYHGFYLDLYNNDTHEWYYLETGENKTDWGGYIMGHIPAGNYQMYIRLKSFSVADDYLSWSSTGASGGGNFQITIWDGTLLSDNVAIRDYGDPAGPAGMEVTYRPARH